MLPLTGRRSRGKAMVYPAVNPNSLWPVCADSWTKSSIISGVALNLPATVRDVGAMIMVSNKLIHPINHDIKLSQKAAVTFSEDRNTISVATKVWFLLLMVDA